MSNPQIEHRRQTRDFPEMTPMTTNFTIEHGWRNRWLAAGRFFLFAILFYGLLLLFGWLAAPLMPPLHAFVWQALEGNLQVLLATLVSTLVLARWEGRSFWQFGFGGSARLRIFLIGVACGAVLLSVLLIAMKFWGAFVFGDCNTSVASALKFAPAYAILFLTVALAEETLWRGYALVNLAKAISFWPAVILISTLFGLQHLHHGQENYLGIFFAIIYSVLLGYSFLRFGSLWFAIGIHASWDYCQSFIFGVPDSGVVVPGSLMKPAISGQAWLTGGSAGPEGSVLMLAVFALLVMVIRRESRPRTGISKIAN
jgi:membrane protease YdiL (CAAX protease family)